MSTTSAPRLPFTLVCPFPPAAKLAPELCSTEQSATTNLLAAVWPDESSWFIARAIESLGGTVGDVTSRAVFFVGSAALAVKVCSLDAVCWVQPAAPAEPFNEDVEWVTQIGWLPERPDYWSGRPIWGRGLDGRGMIVGLFDSGINTDHDAFREPLGPITGPGIFPWHRKIAAYKLYGRADFGDAFGCNYHGTAVAGTLAGDDSATGDAKRLDGVARAARIYFVDLARSNGAYEFHSDMTALLDSVRLGNGMPGPIRQVSGSFGTTTSLGQYLLEEATLDAVCWADKRFLVVWAAGNLGAGPANLGHPSCAKNALVVGATGNGTNSNLIATFSSRGTTADGRQKPDIVAPGDRIFTPYGASRSEYRRRSGTSFSSPAASGALMLVRQYLAEGRNPTGIPDSAARYPDPSSALLRALACIGTDVNVDTCQIPSIASGWGRLNLSRLLRFDADSIGFAFVDDSIGLAGGWEIEYGFTLTNRAPLRVALAWTDTAALPAAAMALVNDLDLELISPDGNCYLGNRFSFGQSQANPAGRDERNNLEACYIHLPLTGRWTVRVQARSVFTERQPFALVVQGGLGGLPGLASPSSPAPAQDSTQTIANGIVPSAAGSLFDVAGRRLAVLAPDGNIARRLPTGVYYLTVNGRTVRKLIITH